MIWFLLLLLLLVFSQKKTNTFYSMHAKGQFLILLLNFFTYFKHNLFFYFFVFCFIFLNWILNLCNLSPLVSCVCVASLQFIEIFTYGLFLFKRPFNMYSPHHSSSISCTYHTHFLSLFLSLYVCLCYGCYFWVLQKKRKANEKRTKKFFL